MSADSNSTALLALSSLRAKVSTYFTTREWKQAFVAGLGGFVLVSSLAEATDAFRIALLIAPFGASSVLVFAAPASPFSQPRNVILGHLISSAVGIATLLLCCDGPVALGISVALCIVLMILTNTVHPPAGADPIVIIASGASWHFLVAPALMGSIAIVAFAFLFHKFITNMPYPASAQPKSFEIRRAHN